MQVAKEKEFKSVHGKAFFSVSQLDGMASTLLFIRLSQRLAPVLAGAREKDKTALIGQLAAALDPAEFKAVTMELLAGKCHARFPEKDLVEADAGNKLGELFKGHPFEIFKLVVFALEVNYSDFSELIGSLGLGSLVSKAGSA